MLKVIGISVTLEYTVKILYENTIGRVFSWFANGTISNEEKTIIAAQRAYSNFIYDTAWYEFKFLPWVKKVWTTSDTTKSSFLRKTERKLFFTFEFVFKAAYAQLIEWAAKNSYETPVTNIYLLVDAKENLESTGDIKILKEDKNKKLLSIPRWGAFTTNLLKLCQKDIEILEIGGNDEIVVSILSNESQNHNFDNTKLLYESDVVTSKKVKRLVYLIPVKQLLTFLKQAKSKKIEVEHVFDY